MEPLVCPNGHTGPWYFVETLRLWWQCEIDGNALVLDAETIDEEPVGPRPQVLSCGAFVNADGDVCMEEMPVPDLWLVVRK